MDFNTTVSANSDPSAPRVVSDVSTSCILYQSHNIILIDVPRSIAAAQGTSQSPWHRDIVSCAPLTSPFPSNEPKSDVAKARLKAKMGTLYDEVYADCISEALSVIHDNYKQEWCLPRVSADESLPLGGKRKLNEIQDESIPASKEEEMIATKELPPSTESSDLLQHLATDDLAIHKCYTLYWKDDPTTGQEKQNPPDPSTWNHCLSNPASRPRRLDISTTTNVRPTSFFIPPGAAFYLGDCTKSRPFHSAVQNLARSENTTHRFDLIVMDPPWPNASVTRARKAAKSGYETAPTMWDLRQLIFEMDVDILLENNGLVAIWITNRPAARDLVLGEDGLFESWNVELEEEWLWIKTTRSGEPVGALNSFWRKPYEVLLLGRKRASQRDVVGEKRDIKRRVIAGVPDLHSRKPCLREFIEPLMPNSSTYRALEIFARYLVAGWWSWGNEVLKFNHERCWIDPVQD